MEKYAIKLPRNKQFTDDEFFTFCQENRNLKFERTAQGEIIIMSPTGGLTGRRNTKILSALDSWNEAHQLGEVFDSSTGFRLPSGAMRSPDASWVENSRWQALSAEEQRKFPPLCPDFVVELMSASDELAEAKGKMEEWMDNGCRLGWLIVPDQEKAFIYQPEKSHKEVQGFDQQLEGEELLPAFVLDLALLK